MSAKEKNTPAVINEQHVVNLSGNDRRREFKSPVTSYYEDLLRQDLFSKQKENMKFTVQEMVDYLIEMNATLRVSFIYTDITRLIYPEQKKLLKQLNKVVSWSKQKIIEYCSQITNIPPVDYSTSVDSSLSWLNGNGLILEVRQGHYAITVMGNDYLSFLMRIRDPDI